jgi:threonine 3-dehydrogenase
VYKEAKVYGTTGRLMWDTWWEMDKLLAAGKLDPMPVITHRLELGEIDRAIDLAKSGQAGKILLIP